MLRAFYAFCKKFSGRCTTHYAVDSELGLSYFRRMRHFTRVQPRASTSASSKGASRSVSA